jgi:HD-GYP domain-containing protein (c-di-GMP phosphodiesterase class II)
MSGTTRILMVMGLVVLLIICLSIFYVSIFNLINEVIVANPDYESHLQIIEGSLLITIFLNVSFIIILGKTIYDIIQENKDNFYTIEILKTTSLIDQQTTIDKLDLYNDRFVKLVGSYAAGINNNIKRVYSSLFQTYKIKSMKTEKDFEKIKMYTAILMRAYAESYNMREIYTDKKIEKISEAAVMYDLGKLGTPGYILYKEGNLEKNDFEMAKRHAQVGYSLTDAIKPNMGQGSFEQYVRDICGFHHERFDGTGYPWGIKGEEIPFIARVIAVVTTYETVTKDRPYRKAMTHEEAVLLINNEKGRYFDPKIVKIFNAVEKEYKKIKERELN